MNEQVSGTGTGGGIGIARSDDIPYARLGLILSWLVIVIGAGVVLTATIILGAGEEGSASEPDAAADVIVDIQGRMALGASLEEEDAGETLLSQLRPALFAGPVRHRLRYIILEGDLAGSEPALRTVAELEDLIQGEEARTADAEVPFLLSPEDEASLETVASLLETRRQEPGMPGVLPDEDVDHLRSHLGWYGELVLAPRGADTAARRVIERRAVSTVRIVSMAVLLMIVLCIGGSVGLLVMIVLALSSRLRSRCHSSPVYHGVYAETFAIWLVLFFVLQLCAGIAAGLLPGDNDPSTPQTGTLVLLLIAFMASFSALLWPVKGRGIPWSQVRIDIGWSWGGGAREFLLAVPGYAMALPILLVGVFVMLVLAWFQQEAGDGAAIFSDPGLPSHPLIGEFAHGHMMYILVSMIVASVAAPLVEETFFRGVLYRHLRDMSRGFGLVVSILFGTMLNSFIFASIHPQGWVAIPALMGLATAFTLMREWRGSLVVPICMHGISNGVILGLIGLLSIL